MVKWILENYKNQQIFRIFDSIGFREKLKQKGKKDNKNSDAILISFLALIEAQTLFSTSSEKLKTILKFVL